MADQVAAHWARTLGLALWAWAPRHGPGGGLTRIDANVDGDATRIPLPDSGFALAVANDTVWVSGLEEGLFAVDTATEEVRLDVDLPGASRGVAVADGDVWVTLRDRQQVIRVDADTGHVVARIDLDGKPWPVAAGAGSVWAATLDGQIVRIVRIDPMTNPDHRHRGVAAEPRASPSAARPCGSTAKPASSPGCWSSGVSSRNVMRRRRTRTPSRRPGVGYGSSAASAKAVTAGRARDGGQPCEWRRWT